MKESLKLVRVFLASPGDLSEERRLVKDAVDEINRRVAPYLGFRVELLGWEDTLPGAGRPQSLINQELDRCELFVGMIWKRWGTPPSTKDHYSSGFEEEFERACLRLKDTKNPEIAMFFKDIGSELTIGTGEDLNKIGEDIKKVKAFQEKLSLEKSIYYKNFTTSYEVQGYVREKVTEYLFNLAQSETDNTEEHSKPKKPIEEDERTQNSDIIKSPFSAEGHSFLKNFLDKTETDDNIEKITPLEVARFRLLSNTISKPGNDEPSLGVHDANIIYSNKQIIFGSREISRLIDCGLKNINHENSPLWHWCSIYKKTVDKNFLPFKSLSDEDIGVGALEAMRLIGYKLPINEKYFNREFFISHWLSEKRADSIKVAALRYLKHHGKNEDMPIIQIELDRANSKTSRISLEATISIQLRHNKSEALKTALKNQFESFDEKLLKEVLAISSNLDDEIFKLGLKHRNKRIRLESFKRLTERKKISSDEIQFLKKDSFSLLRREVVTFLLSNNQPLNDKEIKNILVRPQKTGGLGLGILSSPTLSDEDGQSCHDEYLFSKYFNMSENELLRIIKEVTIFYEIPYFALCSRYFKNHSEELRMNVDDQFKDKFKTYITHLENIGIPDEEIKKIRDIEDFFRKKLTRKALDILCKKGNKKDLKRIRDNMRSGYLKSSESEIEYMQKLGAWEDIPFIVTAEEDYTLSRSSLTILPNNSEWSLYISKAIYNIGKVRIGDLLKTEMPANILVDLIKICSSSKLSEIPDNILLSLLNNNEDEVRKVTSLKIIKFLKKSKIEYLLKEYTDSQEHQYRYYNVIFWLDLAVSMPKSTTVEIVNLVLDE